MLLTDLLPAEKWEELEKEIAERFGLNATVTDNAGSRVTKFDNFCNKLCERIKTDPKGRTAICAVAGQFFASEVKDAEGPIMEECDAGLTKIAVPIIADGEIIGSVGGCGVLIDDAEADDFMVARSLGVDEAELEGCMASVPRMSRAQGEEVQAWMAHRVAEAIGSN